MVDDKEGGHDGPGDSEGGDIGINPSPTIAWQGMLVCGISAWRSDNPGSMIWIIGLLLRPSGRGRLVSSSDNAKAAKLSPFNSLQRTSRMHKRDFLGN